MVSLYDWHIPATHYNTYFNPLFISTRDIAGSRSLFPIPSTFKYLLTVLRKLVEHILIRNLKKEDMFFLNG